jgi:polygalacturonase
LLASLRGVIYTPAMRNLWLPAVAMVCACRSAAPHHKASAASAAIKSVSVWDFGAVGDGKTDDRAAIQSAIDSVAGSGDVLVPAGTYLISTTPGTYWGLSIPSGVHFHGAGVTLTVLHQIAGAGDSARMIKASGENIAIDDLTLDGNLQKQSVNEQRHGIFVTEAQHVSVQRIIARGFSGDGIYLHVGVRDVRINDVTSTGNDRNGITLSGNVDGVIIEHSRFIGNRAQQVDSEPGGSDHIDNVTIANCVIDVAGLSNDYALTVSGAGTSISVGWNVINNTINGGIFVVWAKNVLVLGNHGDNPTTKASFTVYRTSSDVVVLQNQFVQSRKTDKTPSGIAVLGTSTSGPEKVFIIANDVRVSGEQTVGIRLEGAVSVDVVGNTIVGAQSPNVVGVALRATSLVQDFRRANISGNTIRNFAARGVNVGGNGAAKLLSLTIANNRFDNDGHEISLDDGSGAAQKIDCTGNQTMNGQAVPVTNIPPRAVMMDNKVPLVQSN